MEQFVLEQRIDIVEFYIKTGSIKECKEMFQAKYSGKKLPTTSTIQDLYKKWRAVGSVQNVQRNRRLTVRTPETIDRISK